MQRTRQDGGVLSPGVMRTIRKMMTTWAEDCLSGKEKIIYGYRSADDSGRAFPDIPPDWIGEDLYLDGAVGKL